MQSGGLVLRLDGTARAAVTLPAAPRVEVRTDRAALTLHRTQRPCWASAMGRDRYGLWAEIAITPSRGSAPVMQRLRWCPPGRFLMGSPEDEPGRDADERQNEVRLTLGFWLAATACTHALWQAVMGENPNRFKGEQRPVEAVTWIDVQRFIERLNAAVAAFGVVRLFRLPTEAEWEYACRAGTTTPFSFGEDIDSGQVNFDGNYPYRGGKKGRYRGKTVDVATLPANPWGLYEMHGNVWEWCQDWYCDYPTGPVTDPVGAVMGVSRVLRGGCWFSHGRDLRSASRNHDVPGLRALIYGFRLVLGP